MKKLIHEIPLANGLVVRFFDETRRYFGDYHKVRVTISCEVPLTPELFEERSGYEAALKRLGPAAHYLKEVQQQGVAGDETAQTLDRIVRDFEAHSLPYFDSPSFPKMLVRSELNRGRTRSGLFVAMHSHG